MSCFIVGSTGLCGSFILQQASKYYPKVYSLSRSKPSNATEHEELIINDNKDNGWVKVIDELSIEQPDTFFSGLGTTRGKAGGLAEQYKIDHDLNLALAKAAKRKGFRQYVLISSTGANSASRFPYLKMKGELEDHVLELGFEKTVILRPGILLGERAEDHGLGNKIGACVGGWIYNTSVAKYLGSPIRGEEVARAALKLAKRESSEKVIIVSGNDVNIVANSD